MSRTPRVAAALLAATLLAGCGSIDGPQSTAPPSEPAAQAEDGDIHANLPAAGESPTWDEQASADARTAAIAALKAWLRKDLPVAQWERELRPHLTPGAQEAYVYTDPAVVPGTELGPHDTVREGVSPYLATVAIETDAGDYALDLQRLDGGSPWLVDRIHLPENHGADG